MKEINQSSTRFDTVFMSHARLTRRKGHGMTTPTAKTQRSSQKIVSSLYPKETVDTSTVHQPLLMNQEFKSCIYTKSSCMVVEKMGFFFTAPCELIDFLFPSPPKFCSVNGHGPPRRLHSWCFRGAAGGYEVRRGPRASHCIHSIFSPCLFSMYIQSMVYM